MALAKDISHAIHQSSWIRLMFEEGLALKKEFGEENLFDFSLGNPDLAPPAKFTETLQRLVHEGDPSRHGYMPNAGFLDVREKIAMKVSEEHNVVCDASHIVMSVGAAGGLNVIFNSILDPGDEVIVPRPYFCEYDGYVKTFQGELVTVASSHDFSLSLDAIAGAITPRTKAVLINSPHNPTGKVYSKEALLQLAELLRKQDHVIYLIADEPYRDIVYHSIEVPSILNIYEHSLVVTSYSKTLSIPGERIGYVAISPECENVKDFIAALVLSTRILGFVNAPALMQRVVAELLDVKVDVSVYEKRRDLLAAGMKEAGLEFVPPEGAFYLFCKAPIDDDIAFVNYLKEYRILAVPGTGFAAPGYFRLSYCIPTTIIEKSIPVFKAAMQNFKIS